MLDFVANLFGSAFLFLAMGVTTVLLLVNVALTAAL